MSRNLLAMAFVALMVAIIVTVDVVFFRHQFRERLLANTAIATIFVVVYMIFFRHK